MVRRTAWLAALLLAAPGAYAADYWSYEYKNIDVTVAGTSAYAEHVARNADRLGVALAQILDFRPTSRLPTHIYVLPDEEIVQIGRAHV